MKPGQERIRRVILDGVTVGLAGSLLGAVEVANRAGAGIDPLVPAEKLGGIRVSGSAYLITTIAARGGKGK